MTVWEAEVAALVETDWERWIARVEALTGHSADGDQTEDGYSLDHYFDQFNAGLTPEQAA